MFEEEWAEFAATVGVEPWLNTGERESPFGPVALVEHGGGHAPAALDHQARIGGVAVRASLPDE